MPFCTVCGTSAANENKFCASCGAPFNAESIEKTPSTPEVKYAGFWRRCAAMSIEISFYNIIYGVIIYAANIDVQTLSFSGLFWAISILAGFLYITLMNYNYGGTLGKLFVGLRIRKTDGTQDLSYLRCVARYFSFFVSAIPLGIGFFIQPFTKKKQALHDMMAGTDVIDNKRRPAIQIWLINIVYVATTIFVQVVAVMSLE